MHEHALATGRLKTGRHMDPPCGGRCCNRPKRLGGSLTVLLLLLSAGCDDTPTFSRDEKKDASLPWVAMRFDEESTGTVVGRVTWAGDVPQVKPFRAPVSPATERISEQDQDWPNPLVPVVDPKTRGLAEVVVELRGVELSRARQWDHAPVRVEMSDCQFRVRQDDRVGRTGFVRTGDAIEMTSRQAEFDIVQARGVAFFSLAFPDRGPVRSRRLAQRGLVEIVSGAGHFWMRAHLFVSDHPYLTATDRDGRFTLPQVPPGDYQLVCWHPNWQPGDYERDVGTLRYARMSCRPAVEVVQPIRVEAGKTATATSTFSLDDFRP